MTTEEELLMKLSCRYERLYIISIGCKWCHCYFNNNDELKYIITEDENEEIPIPKIYYRFGSTLFDFEYEDKTAK